ncbi:hypothetical protein C1645_832480, partial [Glomus cerebriforme]
MSNHIYDAYYIDVPHENINNTLTGTSNNLTNSIGSVNNVTTINTHNSNINSSTNFNPPIIHYNNNPQRFLSQTFWHVYNKFQSRLLKEYPDTPCVYCGRLLYKNKATWIVYNSSQSYPIEEINQINVCDQYGVLR